MRKRSSGDCSGGPEVLGGVPLEEAAGGRVGGKPGPPLLDDPLPGEGQIPPDRPSRGSLDGSEGLSDPRGSAFQPHDVGLYGALEERMHFPHLVYTSKQITVPHPRGALATSRALPGFPPSRSLRGYSVPARWVMEATHALTPSGRRRFSKVPSRMESIRHP